MSEWQTLADFRKGLQNRVVNPLQYPSDALYDGENMDIVAGGLETRPGAAWHTSGAIWAGATVKNLYQVRFPTDHAFYFLAHLVSGSSGRIYVSTDNLPVTNGSGAWTLLKDLGATTGDVSFTTLANRAIIAEGNTAPQVFLGGLQTSGQDWPTPISVYVTWDSGQNYQNITQYVCDSDSATNANIGNLKINSGWVAVCCDASGLSGLYCEIASGNTSGGSCIVEGYSGAWGSGGTWTDKTSAFASPGSGLITLAGLFSGQHLVQNWRPGYWLRIRFSSGTSANTALQRIKYIGPPCQDLHNIGEASPDIPVGVIYWQGSGAKARDLTQNIIDDSWETVGEINDGAPVDTDKVAMKSGTANSGTSPATDRIYIIYPLQFEGAEIRPHSTYLNISGAVMSGEYFSGGTGWATVAITDGTASASGATLGKLGKVAWTVPSAWKQCSPVGLEYPYGYAIRFYVSAQLTATTRISEVKIWPVPEALKKHKYCMTLRDRLLLGNRSDAPDHVGVSRAREEYGHAGSDAAFLQIGGQDEIISMVEAYNQGFVATGSAWFIFNGYQPTEFAFERAETANQVPVNNKVVIRGPYAAVDKEEKMGLYFLNTEGAWYFTGIQIYNLAVRGDGGVNWWEKTAVPRIDTANLHVAAGAFYPKRNWLVWVVPMILTSVQTEQTSCNRVIVYDLNLQAWLTPFSFTGANFSCLSLAYGYSANSANKLREADLYAGDTSGRIAHLFSDHTTDFGSQISVWAETGWLHFGAPHIEKEVGHMKHYGRLTSGNLTFKLAANGDETLWNSGWNSYTVSGLQSSTLIFSDVETRAGSGGVMPGGRFLKAYWSWSGDGELYGTQLKMPAVRDIKTSS